MRTVREFLDYVTDPENTPLGRLQRRVRALESHIRDLETRYSGLENTLNQHAQGQRHRPPRAKEVPPDVEP